MTVLELSRLFDWCNCAKSNDEFWRRFVLTSTQYKPETRAAMLDFVKVMWTVDEECKESDEWRIV